MASNTCSGDKLPDTDIRRVECSENCDQFSDCCLVAQIGEDVLLYECIDYKGKTFCYWVYLCADKTPLAVCALEKYVERQGWEQRKADYLAVGRHHSGDCYVVVLELRKTLTKEQQFEDKREQLKISIELVISKLLPEIEQSEFFAQACKQPERYKFVGLVVPVTRYKSRAQQTCALTIDGHKVMIAALPEQRLKDCAIDWSNLLKAIGMQ